MPEPRKQTRRAISVSAGTYDRLKAHGQATHRSLSSLVEEAIESFLPQSSGGAERLKRIREIVQSRRSP